MGSNPRRGVGSNPVHWLREGAARLGAETHPVQINPVPWMREGAAPLEAEAHPVQINPVHWLRERAAPLEAETNPPEMLLEIRRMPVNKIAGIRLKMGLTCGITGPPRRFAGRLLWRLIINDRI